MPFQFTPLMPYLSRYGTASTNPAGNGETLASELPAADAADNQ